MRSHDNIQDRLGDYLDGSVPESERLEIARHIEVCPRCARELERLKSLLERARDLPKTIEPPRDLWPGIEARIQSHAVPPQRQRHWSIRPRWVFAGTLAAAAVIAAVVLSPPGDSRKGEVVASQEARSYVPSYVPPLVSALEYQCMGAGKQLLGSVSSGANPLGAEVAAAVEQNVRLLDLAIAETRSALEENPWDPQLLQMLTSRYQRKLSLLHQAMRLVGEA
jgi:predicted anti-sigma-YlaC factor YlaD